MAAAPTLPDPAPPDPAPHPEDHPRLSQRLRALIFGPPKNIRDPSLYHSISLVAFLAWVGLGADGLSSSAYGPDEAYRALRVIAGDHPGNYTYLAAYLALGTALTVVIISYAYSRIIEHFPFGGGGYVVATKLLGPRAGVLSGSALLVDYILTISVSIVAGADAIFSFLPPHWVGLKMPVELGCVGVLIILNLRGVKESVTALMPIFLVFVATHLLFILGGIIGYAGELPDIGHEVVAGTHQGISTIGFVGLFAIFIRAYSLGGGTYTGIEAVSNGISIMREPRVLTGKRTMAYMAASLAFTAGGILLCYLLVHAEPVEGKTMNAVLLDKLVGHKTLGGWNWGHWFTVLALVSEAGLLFVAAQTGFIDGPRVMANMAHDSWLPHRFSALSERLTMKNGVLLMGGLALAVIVYTHGSVDALVVMYSINVFLTFSLTELGMTRFWLGEGRKDDPWRKDLAVHLTGLILCASILGITLYEKFREGGWLTAAFTALLVSLCFAIKRHYKNVNGKLARLDDILAALPKEIPAAPPKADPKKPTAVLLMGGFGGLGIHSLLNVQRWFPGYFGNFVFVSVTVIDSASFQGVKEVDDRTAATDAAMKHYVEVAHALGLPATHRTSVGTEAVAEAVRLSEEVSREFSRCMFFSGKLIFEDERWFYRFLHNETAYAIQRRLQFIGLPMVILPVRVLESTRLP